MRALTNQAESLSERVSAFAAPKPAKVNQYAQINEGLNRRPNSAGKVAFTTLRPSAANKRMAPADFSFISEKMKLPDGSEFRPAAVSTL